MTFGRSTDNNNGLKCIIYFVASDIFCLLRYSAASLVVSD